MWADRVVQHIFQGNEWKTAWIKQINWHQNRVHCMSRVTGLAVGVVGTF